MNVFTIKEAETLTGIKAHTLRIWEQRYEMQLCTDKNGRQRLYTPAEMKFLLRVAYLIKTGYKISQIAKLGNQEIEQLTVQFHPGIARLDTYFNRLFDIILDMDMNEFKRLLTEMQEEYTAETIIQEILLPISKHIEQVNIISKRKFTQSVVAQQWISEYICHCTEFLPKQYQNNMRLFILFTPPQQNFETSLLFTNYQLRKNYIQTIYLGKNIEPAVLKQLLQRFPHASLCFDMGYMDFSASFRNYIHALTEFAPTQKIFYSLPPNMGFYANLPKNVHGFKAVEEILYRTEVQHAEP